MSKQVDDLTLEQKARIPYYLDKYFKIGTDTTPCDRAKAEDAVQRSYKYLNLQPVTKFVWFSNPFDAAREAARLANDLPSVQGVQASMVADQASKASYGSLEAYWVAFYDFIASELEKTREPLIDIVIDIVSHCGVYWTFEGLVIMSEKPSKIELVKGEDGQYRVSSTTGYGIQYADGTGVYAVNGTAYNTLMEATMEAVLGAPKETA